jgi:hypothetical protein
MPIPETLEFLAASGFEGFRAGLRRCRRRWCWCAAAAAVGLSPYTSSRPTAQGGGNAATPAAADVTCCRCCRPVAYWPSWWSRRSHGAITGSLDIARSRQRLSVRRRPPGRRQHGRTTQIVRRLLRRAAWCSKPGRERPATRKGLASHAQNTPDARRALSCARIAVLTRIDFCSSRRVSRHSRVHGFTQCGYFIEQAGEIIAIDNQHLGRPRRRYGRITQFPAAEHRFADHLTRLHHGNAVPADVHRCLPAEQDVAGVRRSLLMNQRPCRGRRGAMCCSDEALQVVVRKVVECGELP